MRQIDFVYYGSDTPIVPVNTILATVGNNVTSLPPCLFHNKYHLRFVTIPSNVTSIGSRMFQNCTRLCSVNLHPHLKVIGTSAFNQCHSLEDIYLPSHLQYLEFRVFASCSIKVLNLPPSLLSIEQWAFKDCQQLLRLKINSDVININEEAIVNCNNLIDIEVSDMTRCLIISSTFNNRYPNDLVNNRMSRLKDHFHKVFVIGKESRMKTYTISSNSTITILLDMIGVDSKSIIRKHIGKYRKFVVMIDWKLSASYKSIKTGRYPLFSAAFNNLHVNQGLKLVFNANAPAIYSKDPLLDLEAFMVAAIGESSRLSSIYFLLRQYPQAINQYVSNTTTMLTNYTSSNIGSNNKKRKKYN